MLDWNTQNGGRGGGTANPGQSPNPYATAVWWPVLECFGGLWIAAVLEAVAWLGPRCSSLAVVNAVLQEDALPIYVSLVRVKPVE